MTRRIRSASEGDAAAIQAVYAPIVRETAISFELEPPGVAEIAKRIATIQEQFPYLVCEIDGQVVGYAYAMVFRDRPAYRWSVESSVYVSDRFRRCGAASALYASLFDALRRQGFVRVIAGITLPNAASVALHERFGFTPVGVFHRVGYKFDTWHDVGFWELTLRDITTSPEEPQPIH
jgi:L-amino acid N-acyltransferase YncA